MNRRGLHHLLITTLILVFSLWGISQAAIENVTVSNHSSSSVTITWTSSDSLSGCVNYGLSAALGTAQCQSLPDGTVHMVSIAGLTADTLYYFEVISGGETDDNDGNYYSFHTTGTGQGSPYVVYGTVLLVDGSTPAQNTAVLLRLHSGSTISYPLSTMSAADGSWVLNLGNLKDEGDGSVLPWQAGDSLTLEFLGGADGQNSDTGVVGTGSPQSLGSVSLIAPPSVSCPVPVDTTLCGSGTVCIEVSIAGEETVNVQPTGATWTNDSLCIPVDTAGTYVYGIIAGNSVGADTCSVQVTVTLQSPPVIVCPGSSLDSLCAPAALCLTVPITNADTVSSSHGTWSSDQICFQADTSGVYEIELIAENACGADTCLIAAEVVIVPPVVIDCPAPVVDTVLCGPREVCVGIPVSGQETVTVSYGSWVDDSLCFLADTAGSYVFQLIGSNSCDEDTCDFAVNVVFPDTPQISCPGAVDTVLCTPGEICMDLVISGHETVTASFGTWSDDILCFTADTAGIYSITVAAFNPCDTAECVVSVTVSFLAPPQIDCGGQLDTALCQGDTIRYALAVTGYDQVSVDAGWWQSDTLYFVATAGGFYTQTVIATNRCAADTCEVGLNLNVIPPPIIDCPGSPVQAGSAAGEQLCVPLAVSGSMSVVAEGAWWQAGSLCFTTDTAGLYEFTVVALGDCTDDTCQIVINVNFGCCRLRGDVDENDRLNVSDLSFLVNYLFKGGPAPACFDHGDMEAGGTINVADLTYLVNYLFKGGPEPVPCS